MHSICAFCIEQIILTNTDPKGLRCVCGMTISENLENLEHVVSRRAWLRMLLTIPALALSVNARDETISDVMSVRLLDLH